MNPRWVRRMARVRAFDQYTAIHGPGWRSHSTALGLDPDRVVFMARMLAATTDPTTAWRTAVDHYVREQRWMDSLGRHSCPTCRALGRHSAPSEYLAWLETTYRWEMA